MQSATPIEKEIVDGVRALPASKQQEVLAFVDSLRQKVTEPSKNRLSMQEIAQLPVHERHQYLQQYIPAMVEDFANDPALTEFSEVDMDDWAAANSQF
jgi:hypothetical protein